MRWLATLVLLAGALAGCGEAEDHAEVACSISGQTRFAAAFLEGPEFTPEEFAAATQEGPVLAAFFLGGAGEPENHHYMASEGFTVVSEGLVLAYQNGIPFADFSIEDGGVHGWGGCRPNLVDVDLVAYRWVPLPPVDRDATAVGIGVEGGGCVVAGKTDIVTEVVRCLVNPYAVRRTTGMTRSVRRLVVGVAVVGGHGAVPPGRALRLGE